MNSHARLLDRRRLELLFDEGKPDAVLTALAAYANDDGGFGWARCIQTSAPEGAGCVRRVAVRGNT